MNLFDSPKDPPEACPELGDCLGPLFCRLERGPDDYREED
jgi:hypothetical protein